MALVRVRSISGLLAFASSLSVVRSVVLLICILHLHF